MIINVCLVIILMCMSIDDIKHKSISLMWTIIEVVFLFLLRILTGYHEWKMILFGVIPGLFVMVIVKIFRIKLGVGDGICFMLIGIVRGALFSIRIIMVSFFMTSIGCIILLILRQVKRKTEIPMIPFITISCVGVMLCG